MIIENWYFQISLWKKSGDISLLHMKVNHSLLSKLGATACLGVEVILSLSAHQDFAILGDLEAFGK